MASIRRHRDKWQVRWRDPGGATARKASTGKGMPSALPLRSRRICVAAPGVIRHSDGPYCVTGPSRSWTRRSTCAQRRALATRLTFEITFSPRSVTASNIEDLRGPLAIDAVHKASSSP